ncbi:nucleolar protein 9-like [Saccoglossus kowalevskii]|uniref:Nucleolar protein 9-like n=1 Tax=Saccoglossus kowalevskii TaxID=10224 RepID=A0ABM0MA84_SACKO|nr:PREDICTED: nucleolar protein 9-like [Saccoglossus kowalevskii]
MAASTKRGRPQKSPFRKGQNRQNDRPAPGRLDEETMGYYRRVSDTLKEEFSSEEEKELFIQNVFAQTQKEEIKLSQNQTVSRLIESLLRSARQKEVTKFFAGLSEDIHKVCFDRFAAYVLQTVITLVPKFLDSEKEKEEQDDDDDDDDDLPSLEELLLQVCGVMKEHLGDVLVDTYASHVLRSLLEVLGGVHIAESVVRSKLSRQQQNKESTKQTKEAITERRNVPKKFSKNLKKLTNLVMERTDIHDLLQNPVSNPVLQTLLLVLNKVNSALCGELSEILLSKSDAVKKSKGTEDDLEESLPTIFLHEVGSHLVEVLLQISSEESFHRLYCQYFKGKILQFAVHPIANFVLQKLIAVSPTREEFDEIFEECNSIMEDILAYNHIGIVLRLAEGCIKYGVKQELLLKSLLKAFHCYRPKTRRRSCVQLIASFTTYEVFHKLEDEKDEKDEELNSEGWYVKLSCTKHGSRTIDAIWNGATLKNKYTIAEELAKRESQLSQDMFGRFVYRNCAIGYFKHRPKDWKDIQKREEKKRKMFADLLEDEPVNIDVKPVIKETKKSVSVSMYETEMKALGFDEDGLDEKLPSEDENSIDVLFSQSKKSSRKHEKTVELQNDIAGKKRKHDIPVDTSPKKIKKKKSKTRTS